MNVAARPAVQRIIVSSEGEGPLVDDLSSSCTITIGVYREEDFLESVNISPFDSEEELQDILNEVESISEVGHVMVQKGGYNGTSEELWSSDEAVEITVIFLTRAGVAVGDMITIAVAMEDELLSCIADNENSTLLVVVETVQALSYPTSYDIGFNISSQLQRRSQPLPLDASAETVHEELTEMLSWGCVVEDNLAAKTLAYEDYEESVSEDLDASRDNSTSFCGLYSERDPDELWSATKGEAFSVNEIPYVSNTLASWFLIKTL